MILRYLGRMHRHLWIATLCIGNLLAASAIAAPGDLDTAFGAGLSVNNVPAKAVVQADGKVLLAGKTFTVNGRTRHGLFRLNADGTPDLTFQPATYPGMDITSIAIQTDGRILAAGLIASSTSETPRPTVARYTVDGRLDTTFNRPVLRGDAPAGASPAMHLLIHPVTGIHVTESGISGTEQLSTVRQLASNGQIISAYDHGQFLRFGFIHALVARSDGKVLAVGGFTSGLIGGTFSPLPNIVRINVNGTYDTTFTSGLERVAGREIFGALAQLDGNVILHGTMSFDGGSGSVQIARMLENGGQDTTFSSVPIVGAPYGRLPMSLQSDGKLVVALPGAVPTDITWPGNLIRLNSDGTLDNTFAGNTAQNVSALSLQADGKLLVVGEFASRIERRLNDAGGREITLPEANRIRWTRNGSSSMPSSVLLQYYPNQNLPDEILTPLSGNASYIGSGRWDWFGYTPTGPGVVRALALMPDGSREVQTLMIGTPTSEIHVSAPGKLTSGVSNVDFGGDTPGTATIRSFNILNLGAGDLTGINVTFDGVGASAYEIVAAPVTTLSTQETTTFLVKFLRPASGSYPAFMRITSNDPDESPFNLTLTGTGYTPQQSWRFGHFNSADNTGDAADLADFDKDGVLNLMEFAFDLDPKSGNATNGAAKLPEPVVEDEHLVIRFTPPAAGVAAGLTYGAQASATLEADSWTPVTNTGTGGVHEYKIPLNGELRFMKVTVNGGGS
jgi:uncharacterized delta-60 repeat protein